MRAVGSVKEKRGAGYTERVCRGDALSWILSSLQCPVGVHFFTIWEIVNACSGILMLLGSKNH